MKIFPSIYCYIGTLLIFFDRTTKIFAEKNIDSVYHITSFFSYEVVHNTGISFSLFADKGPFVFSILTILISILLYFFVKLMIERSKLGCNVMGECLIVAGGIGNLLDRVYYGYVIDFIFFHYKTWSYPHFNIADICIVTGVFIMLIQLLKIDINKNI